MLKDSWLNSGAGRPRQETYGIISRFNTVEYRHQYTYHLLCIDITFTVTTAADMSNGRAVTAMKKPKDSRAIDR